MVGQNAVAVIENGITHVVFEGANLPGQIAVDEILSGAEQTMHDGGSFSELSGKVDSIGGGAYHVAYKIGIFAGLFAIIVCCIRLMFANTNERQELKSKLIWIIVACAAIMGVCAILLFVSSLSNGLFGS